MGLQEQEYEQLERLHEQFVPQLYRAAVYLLGDSGAAETAVSQAWPEAISKRTCWSDEQDLGIVAAKILLRYCQNLQKTECCYDSGLAENDYASPLLEALSSLPFKQRCLIVLAAVQNYTANEIAQIIERPAWLVKRKLRHVSQRVCSSN